MTVPQKHSPRTTRQVVSENAPWKPAAWELPDAAALQALMRGDATKEQQTRALKWLIESACGTYDMSYRPGESSRDTDFAEGRRSVGLQIVKLVKMNLSELRRKENG
jgi:hypothetical protein